MRLDREGGRRSYNKTSKPDPLRGEKEGGKEGPKGREGEGEGSDMAEGKRGRKGE